MSTPDDHGNNESVNSDKPNSSDIKDQTFKEKLDQFGNKVQKNLKIFWDKTKKKTRQTGRSIKSGFKTSVKWLDDHHAIQFIMALILSTVGVLLSTRVFDLSDSRTIWMYVLTGLGVVGGIALWVLLAKKRLGRLLYYIVEHKYVRKIFAGGSFSYFEYQSEDDYRLVHRFTEPFGQMITSLIAFLGIATASVGLIRFFSPNLDTSSPILWGILGLITPIIATLIIPVAWTLTDTRIKAWNEKNETTWMVSKKFKRRLNSFITVGAVISNLRSNVGEGSIGNQIDILISILRVGAVVMLMSIGFFIIFYYAWYRNHLRRIALESLGLKSYSVELIEHDVKDSKIFKQIKDLDRGIQFEEETDQDDAEKDKSEIVKETDETESDQSETETEATQAQSDEKDDSNATEEDGSVSRTVEEDHESKSEKETNVQISEEPYEFDHSTNSEAEIDQQNKDVEQENQDKDS